jgi:hypothetical protein
MNMGDVFLNVTRPSAIVIVSADTKRNPSIDIGDFTDLKREQKEGTLRDSSRYSAVKTSDLIGLPNSIVPTKDLDRYKIWRKILKLKHDVLKNIVDADGIQRGVSPDFKDAFVVEKRRATAAKLEPEKLRRVVTGGRHVKRYRIDEPSLRLIYTSRLDDFDQLPHICNHIDGFKEEIKCKEVKQGKHSIYSLHRARKEKIFTKPEKYVGVITEDEIIVARDSTQIFATDGCYLFGLKDKVNGDFVLGVLNSKLFVFLYRLLAIEGGRALAQVKPSTLVKLPIRKCNSATEKKTAKKISNFVSQRLQLEERLLKANASHHRTSIGRQIESVAAEIDRLVFDLYELNESERNIVNSLVDKDKSTAAPRSKK